MGQHNRQNRHRQRPKNFLQRNKKNDRNASNISPYIIHNEKKLYDPRLQEPIFRDYWKNIFTSEDPNDNNFDYEFTENIENQLDERTERITPHNNSDINRLNINNCPPISHTEVTDVIKAMKHKAPGPNKLTANQLKNLPPNMTNFLTEIFNHSLSAGYFPNSYKHATMTIIPKAGTSGTAVKDKRPISLLNVDGKLLDQILNKRHYTFLEENNLQNETNNLHGFRRNRGTQTAILTLHETISKHLSLKHKVDIACRDVTKAFDKIWHTGLKYKITELGLHSCYEKTLSNYLTNRTASIKIGHISGPKFKLESVIPQGACLSPTLFNMYVKDIPEPLVDTDYLQYADDITQIIALPGNPRAIANNTKLAIEEINNYENKWKIQTNINKFQIMNVSRRNTAPVIVNRKEINYTNKTKILGMTYSTHGMSPQVEIRKTMAMKTLTRIQRFRNLSEKNKRKLYLTIVRPQLLYPIIPLNTISKTAHKKLQIVQNKALRFIENTTLKDRIPSTTLHARNKLPTINTYLHRRAINVWTQLQDKNPE